MYLLESLTRSAEARRSTTVALPAGATLCAYTDGLVERRGEYLDDGLARLTRAVYPGAAEAVCATVMADLIGTSNPEDDVAVLVLRRT